MNSITSYPFFVEQGEEETSYHFLDVCEDMLPCIRVMSHCVEDHDRFDTSYVDFAGYMATENSEGVARLLKVVGMYLASDNKQESLSVFIEGLN